MCFNISCYKTIETADRNKNIKADS